MGKKEYRDPQTQLKPGELQVYLELWTERWVQGEHNYGKRVIGFRRCWKDAARNNRRAKAIIEDMKTEVLRRAVIKRLKV